MRPRARVVAFGQASAGDDGVALAVLEALRRGGVPAEVELCHLADPSALVALLEEAPSPVVIVDAVLAAPPGSVLELSAGELAARGLSGVSSHGIGVADALALAGALGHDVSMAALRIVAVAIARPAGRRAGLSPEVAAAVPGAAERVLGILAGMGG